LFDEIAEDFLAYSREHKKSAEHDKARMSRLKQTFGGRAVGEIGAQEVEQLRRPGKEALSSQCEPAPGPPEGHIQFNRAMRAEPPKSDRNPVRGVKLLKENNERVRVLTDAEEGRLLAALPDYLHPLIVVALHTGMRRGELAHVEWEHVDFHTRTLVVTKSKSGEGRRVPMNRVVVETLQVLRKARKAFRGLVFTSPQGEFLHNFGRAWTETVKNAKITDLRFHDLRHTAASRMVMGGVDLYTVKEILGHKTLVMTQRYSHLSPAHQRQAVERLVRRRKGNAKVTDPVTARAAVGATSGDDVSTEEKWWTGGELNSRHRDFQSRALPTELPVHRAGEPPEAVVTLPDGPTPVQRARRPGARQVRCAGAGTAGVARFLGGQPDDRGGSSQPTTTKGRNLLWTCGHRSRAS
jgi:integrase